MELQLKQSYSFEVHPVALLGNNFKNATVLAIMDQETANQSIDTQALHVQVYPSVPAGSMPNNPAEYTYVKLRLANGGTTIIGRPWIKENTIVQQTSTTIRVTVPNVVPADVARIRNALVQNGFTVSDVSIV